MMSEKSFYNRILYEKIYEIWIEKISMILYFLVDNVPLKMNN